MQSKNVTQERKNQSGAILIEVLVVISLIGLLLPVIYRHVAARLEESRNVIYAGELRAVKEGFENYIREHNPDLQARFKTADETDGIVEIDEKDVCPYLPAGYCDTTGIVNFDVVPLDTGLVDDVYIIRGLVLPDAVVVPTMSTKRAARVATLAGVDAGIWGPLTNYESVDGVLGIWHFDTSDEFGKAIVETVQDFYGFADGKPTDDEIEAVYVALTAPDLLPITETPDTFFNTEEKAGKAGENQALKQTYAWRHFSVGGNKKCFDTANGSRNSANEFIRNDDVFVTGEGECDPLFWVSTIGHKDESGNWVDDSAGQVYVKNNVLVGAPAGATAAAIELKDVRTTSTQPKGSVFVKGADNDLTIADGQIATSKEITDKNGNTYDAVLDPAFTSTLNEIQLVSRGNVSLSEILPNYILKAVYPLECGGSASESSCTAKISNTSTTSIPKPECPTGYARAVIVTPTKWDNATQTVTDANGVKTVKKFNFAVTVDGKPTDFARYDAPHNAAANAWTVKMGYKNPGDGASVFTSGTLDRSWTAYAHAQTYCVYDPKEVCPASTPIWSAELGECVECLDNTDCNNGLETGSKYCASKNTSNMQGNYYKCLNVADTLGATKDAYSLSKGFISWWDSVNFCLAQGKALLPITAINTSAVNGWVSTTENTGSPTNLGTVLDEYFQSNFVSGKPWPWAATIQDAAKGIAYVYTVPDGWVSYAGRASIGGHALCGTGISCGPGDLYWNGSACVCPPDKPVLVGTTCSACPTATPYWHSALQICTDCPDSNFPIRSSYDNTCVQCTENWHCPGNNRSNVGSYYCGEYPPTAPQVEKRTVSKYNTCYLTSAMDNTDYAPITYGSYVYERSNQITYWDAVHYCQAKGMSLVPAIELNTSAVNGGYSFGGTGTDLAYNLFPKSLVWTSTEYEPNYMYITFLGKVQVGDSYKPGLCLAGVKYGYEVLALCRKSK